MKFSAAWSCQWKEKPEAGSPPHHWLTNFSTSWHSGLWVVWEEDTHRPANHISDHTHTGNHKEDYVCECVCARTQVCICASVCMRAGIHAKSGSLNLCLWTLVKWTNHTSAIQITHRKNDETHWNGVWPLRLNSTQCNILNLCECPWSKMWIHNKSNQVFHAVKGWWTSS